MTDSLAMIVPSRGRPESVSRLHEAYEYTSSHTEFFFVVDADDPTLDDYRLATRKLQMPLVTAPEGLGGMNAVLNWAATSEIFGGFSHLGFMGDDHMPREFSWPVQKELGVHGFWDLELLREIPYWVTPLGDKSHIGIVYGNDLLQGERMATAVVMSRQIVDTLGYMAPPALKHLCLDLVWCDWGRGINRLYYRDDVIIEHLHPANGKAAMDPGYERVNSPEITSSDAQAYYAYCDATDGGLTEDLMKLEALVGQ